MEDLSDAPLGEPGGGPRPLRWELWRFDLSKRAGREQRGLRPCLIVSGDGLNRSAFGTVVACPLTTTERPSFRWRVEVGPTDLRVVHREWEARRSWVQTDQIVTVDTGSRAVEKLAALESPDRRREVQASLRLILDL